MRELATTGPDAAAASGCVGALTGVGNGAAAARGCTAVATWLIGARFSGLVGAADAGEGESFSAARGLAGTSAARGVNASELSRTEADRMSGRGIDCRVGGVTAGATINAVAVIAAMPALNKGLAVRSISLLCVLL
ncbi:Uncharacterised protein [Mycobacteroides abscessus subsp. abscessus]|nr:Uncharacterised protein [Mycobacteroides abscessus subsp. abscessus]